MQAAQNVLVKKLNHGGVARSPLPDADSIGQAFARQLEDRLRPLVKASISAMVLECKIVKVSEAVEDISVPAILGMVEVEHAALKGLVVSDTELSYHLIDLALGGDASEAPIPITRAFTEIDKAICKLALKATISSFIEALTLIIGKPMEKEVKIVDIRQDISQTRFAPDYVDVLVFNLVLDIGEAARSGSLQLLLPLATLDVMYAAMKEKAVVEDSKPQDLWKKMMRQAAAVAPVAVSGVLHRHRMTISKIQEMRKGDILEIPSDATDRVELTLDTRDGKSFQIATGRLGTYQGAKVVKLTNDVDERVVEQIRKSL